MPSVPNVVRSSTPVNIGGSTVVIDEATLKEITMNSVIEIYKARGITKHLRRSYRKKRVHPIAEYKAEIEAINKALFNPRGLPTHKEEGDIDEAILAVQKCTGQDIESIMNMSLSVMHSILSIHSKWNGGKNSKADEVMRQYEAGKIKI